MASSARICITFLAFSAVAAAQQPGHGFRAREDVPAPSLTDRRSTLSAETRGDIYMARKRYLEAIDMYRQGRRTRRCWLTRSASRFTRCLRLDLAQKNYQRAIKLNPKYSEAINNLGTIYYAAKGLHRAIKYYKRALKDGAKPAPPCIRTLGRRTSAAKITRQRPCVMSALCNWIRCI